MEMCGGEKKMQPKLPAPTSHQHHLPPADSRHHLVPDASPPSGFFHPTVFNSGLAAAIAAAEYQRREASAAAHTNGMQPFLLGFPNSYGQHLPTSNLTLPYDTQQQLPQGSPSTTPQSASPEAFSGRAEMVSATAPPGTSPQLTSPGSCSPSVATGSSSPDNTESPSPSSTPNFIMRNPGAGNAIVAPPRLPVFSNGRPELPPPKWYDASVPLGVDEDKHYLSELQCVLRSEFVEVFGTTQTDIVLPVHGRNKPIALGQVGVRCIHCRDTSTILQSNKSIAGDKNRPSAQNAISYPSFLSGIYNTVQHMYRLHFEQCPCIPVELKSRVSTLKDSHTSNRGGRKQYWIDSAKRIGLVDTSFGIHYGRDPKEPLPSLGRGFPRHSEGEEDIDELGLDTGNDYWERSTSYGSASLEGGEIDSNIIDDLDIYPLVTPDEKHLVTDYLYLALEQMQPCNLMEADRVGCYKGRRTGFPGLACKHCIGQAGCGRYFPASEASLSQTTTSQTIVNHVRNCRRCPLEVREQLELMKRATSCPSYKKSDKPKHGGRKVFFRRLWCRIQRIPLHKNDKIFSSPTGNGCESFEKYHLISSPSQVNDERAPTSYGSFVGKKRMMSTNIGEIGNRKVLKRTSCNKNDCAGGDNFNTNTEGHSVCGVIKTIEFGNVHKKGENSSPRNNGDKVTMFSNRFKINEQFAFHGRARLTRGDDMLWLSESDCFIRQELAEVFTAQEDDLNNFGNSHIGQVGVRCFYCAENLSPGARKEGHVFYPSSIAAVQQAVLDLQRVHFGICAQIPDQIRNSFLSMKNYKTKPKGDIAQYWKDSAKELGLHDVLGYGVYFFRNPLNSSTADKIDKEKSVNRSTGSDLVPSDDLSKGTDHMVLLLKQFKPCQFHASDRKSSRSRDRSIGFPGQVCVHCMQKRFFPISEKKLHDSLSLMATHIHNCLHTPLDIKASLCYLQHGSLVQRQAGQFKSTCFKGVWNKLHQGCFATPSNYGAQGDGAKASISCDPGEGFKSAAMDYMPLLEEESFVRCGMSLENSILCENNMHKQDHSCKLREMKDLIKSAALWLLERDLECDVLTQCGRGKGTKRK